MVSFSTRLRLPPIKCYQYYQHEITPTCKIGCSDCSVDEALLRTLRQPAYAKNNLAGEFIDIPSRGPFNRKDVLWHICQDYLAHSVASADLPPKQVRLRQALRRLGYRKPTKWLGWEVLHCHLLFYFIATYSSCNRSWDKSSLNKDGYPFGLQFEHYSFACQFPPAHFRVQHKDYKFSDPWEGTAKHNKWILIFHKLVHTSVSISSFENCMFLCFVEAESVSHHVGH